MFERVKTEYNRRDEKFMAYSNTRLSYSNKNERTTVGDNTSDKLLNDNIVWKKPINTKHEYFLKDYYLVTLYRNAKSYTRCSKLYFSSSVVGPLMVTLLFLFLLLKLCMSIIYAYMSEIFKNKIFFLRISQVVLF